MKDPYQPRGRDAHEGRLNRVGQAWQQVTVWACICDPGSAFYQQEVRVDTSEHRRCPDCGEVILYNELEEAMCRCKVWKDSTAPKIYDRDLRKFFAMCKA